MIKKVYVPKYLYPVSSIFFNYIIFLISLIVLVAVSLVMGVFPTLYVFQAVVPLFILMLLCIGCGMILSTIGVFFRDMEYLWNVFLMLIMYTCAIFYMPDRLLDSSFGWVLKYNPLYCIISNFRSAIFGELMDMNLMLYSLVFSVVSIILGVYMFKTNEDKFILHI